MLLYLIIILICMSVIATANSILSAGGYGFWYIILMDICCTVAVIIIDALVAFIIRYVLPQRLFDVNKRGFCASRNEKVFLEKLGIKKWKDRIPELGGFTAFHKDKIYNPRSSEYLKRFIVESNTGIACHLAGGIVGFLIVFFYPFSTLVWVALPVATVNLILNILPMEVLRYNLYKLRALYNCCRETTHNQNI